jgi:hypothetical protein
LRREKRKGKGEKRRQEIKDLNKVGGNAFERLRRLIVRSWNDSEGLEGKLKGAIVNVPSLREVVCLTSLLVEEIVNLCMVTSPPC